MANFKVVYRVDMETKGEDGLAWEPGCPVAFRAIQVSRNVNTADAFLQAEVRNVSREEIGSFKARFDVSSEPVAIPWPKLLGLSDDARHGRQAPAVRNAGPEVHQPASLETRLSTSRNITIPEHTPQH